MRQYSHTAIPFPLVTVSAAQTVGTVQMRVALPFDAKVVGIMTMASGIGTGSPTVNVYDSGMTTPASVLVAAKTIAAANTPYYVNVSNTYKATEYKKGRVFGIRATTPASTGALTNLQVVLLVERLDR